ncbi:MAG: DUF115 domain-containing protein [Anaerolineaceae bacterium]|nr:DUF115 domain-containing protein [Anaerolineaceae bacterium]
MEKLKDTIKKLMPEAVMNHIRNEKDVLQRLPQDLEAVIDPFRRETIRSIKKFHNRHQGERCFVIGNGPSLQNTDMTKLRNEYTFGLNRIYLMFEELGFSTSFFVSINDLVIEQSAADIQALKIPKFVSWRSRKWLTPQDDLFYLYTTYTGPKFARNVAGRMWEGATVTYVALQLAYYFGFSKVILIGVDHSFATKGKPNTTITSEGDDPNHFDPKYFGKGFRWQLPDLETSEIAYKMAHHAFEAGGRKVVDATVGGKLTVFPKVDYDSLF